MKDRGKQQCLGKPDWTSQGPQAKKKQRPNSRTSSLNWHFPQVYQSDSLKKRQSPTRPRTKQRERKVRTYRWLSIKYKHSSPVLVQEFSISGPGSPTRFEYQVTGRVSGRQKQVHSRCRPESNVNTEGPKAEAFFICMRKRGPGQQCRV